MTKWDGFLTLSFGAQQLFVDEFKLHLFGGEYSFPFPETMATLSALGETILPVLLVFGLATRYAALGILAMTAIIQLTVPDGWANFHLPWAAMALSIMTFGPGRIALDRAPRAGARAAPRARASPRKPAPRARAARQRSASAAMSASSSGDVRSKTIAATPFSRWKTSPVRR